MADQDDGTVLLLDHSFRGRCIVVERLERILHRHHVQAFRRRMGITLSQLDPSANAPCTSTTFLPFRSSGADAALAGVNAESDSRPPSKSVAARHFLSSVFIM